MIQFASVAISVQQFKCSFWYFIQNMWHWRALKKHKMDLLPLCPIFQAYLCRKEFMLGELGSTRQGMFQHEMGKREEIRGKKAT